MVNAAVSLLLHATNVAFQGFKQTSLFFLESFLTE